MAIIRISEKTEKRLDEISKRLHHMQYEDISKDFLLNSILSELEKGSKTISSK
jgi:hypothetical protein